MERPRSNASRMTLRPQLVLILHAMHPPEFCGNSDGAWGVLFILEDQVRGTCYHL